MTKPMENKTEAMKEVIESFFPGTKASIEKGQCPMCKSTDHHFRDALSRKEWAISGLCQACQDTVFVPLEKDND
jgi:hypothetical protein